MSHRNARCQKLAVCAWLVVLSRRDGRYDGLLTGFKSPPLQPGAGPTAIANSDRPA